MLLVAPSLRAVGPTFTPDVTFRGSQLTGWRPVGGATWTARDGVIAGTPAPGGAGGWLWLERAYQDVGLYLSFRCRADCDAGVLLRAETTGGWVQLTFHEIAVGTDPTLSGGDIDARWDDAESGGDETVGETC